MVYWAWFKELRSLPEVEQLNIADDAAMNDGTMTTFGSITVIH